MNQNNKKNNISWLIVFLILMYMGFTQRIQNEAQEMVEASTQVVVAIYDVEEVYKLEGRNVASKFVADPSHNGLGINGYYKDKNGEVFIDFSDLKLNKRYLMRIKANDTKDKRADYNMDNSLLLHTKNIMDTIKNNESLKAYTSFYVRGYKAKETEGLVSLGKSITDTFEPYLDKEYIEEDVEEDIEKVEEKKE